jgi:hypothetical protein
MHKASNKAQSVQQGPPSNSARLEPLKHCSSKKKIERESPHLQTTALDSNLLTRPERQRRGGIQKKRLAFELAGVRQ